MPIGTSMSPVLTMLPVSANAFVRGLFSGPIDLYQSAPREVIEHIGEVSTLLSTVGLSNSPCSTVRGGFTRGHAALALDGGGQCAALAADERARAPRNVQREAIVRAEDVVAEQAKLLRLRNRAAKPLHRERILRADMV